MLDIVVIGRNRHGFLEQTLKGIWATAKDYRLTVVDDYSDRVPQVILDNIPKFHQIILNSSNKGSTYSMDTGLQLAFMNQWFFDDEGDILFLEDDIVLCNDWQAVCQGILQDEAAKHKIAFIGNDWEEHKVSLGQFEYKGHMVKIKKEIRSSVMYARKSTWQGIGLPGRVNPNGTKRGNPGPEGLGSRRDWFYLKDSSNSIEKQGLLCAAVSGLVTHLGEGRGNSTWRL